MKISGIIWLDDIIKKPYMGEYKSSISQAKTYQEIGEFWDTHDVTDYWDQTESVEFEVDIQSEARYYTLDEPLMDEVSKIALQKGLSVSELVNLWIKDRVKKEAA